ALGHGPRDTVRGTGRLDVTEGKNLCRSDLVARQEPALLKFRAIRTDTVTHPQVRSRVAISTRSKHPVRPQGEGRDEQKVGVHGRCLKSEIRDSVVIQV